MIADKKEAQRRLSRLQTVSGRMKTRRQLQKDSLQDAFDKFEHYERRMDNMEGELESMDIGQDDRQRLANQIDSLAQDESINSELDRVETMERYVTSKRYNLDREFSKIQD